MTDVVLVFLLLTLNIFQTFPRVSIVDFEQVNVCWEYMNLTNPFHATGFYTPGFLIFSRGGMERDQ